LYKESVLVCHNIVRYNVRSNVRLSSFLFNLIDIFSKHLFD